MTRTLTLAALLCLLSAALARPIPANEPRGAVIELADETVQLPEVLDGHSVEFGTTVRNTGDAELVVEEITSNCPCTVGQMEKTVLAPGESTPLRAVFDSTGRPGTHYKYVEIRSNATNRPKARLGFDVHVRAPMEVRPDALRFERVGYGHGATLQVVVENQFEPLVEVRDVTVLNTRVAEAELVSDSTVEVVDPAIGQPAGPMRRAVIEVRVQDDAPMGKFMGMLEIETDSREHGTITIPISGEVMGDLVHEPRMVKFGSLAPGESATAELLLESLSGQALSVSAVDTGELPITWESLPADPGQARLRLTLSPGEEHRVVRGYIHVQSNHPEHPRLKVAVHGVVR